MMRNSRLRAVWLPAICVAICAVACSAQADTGSDATPPSSGAQKWLRRFGRVRAPDANERNHPDVRAAFREVVRPASRCTVRVLCNGIQVALGTVVRSDGYIVSKASELSGDIECHFSDGRRWKAQLIAVHNPTDLAILKVAAHDLPTVEWAGADALAAGSWLATAGLDETPAAIGIVSAPLHAVAQPKPVLGVLLEDSQEGPQVGRVIPRSPAARAGLQAGDVIVRLDGRGLSDREALIQAVGSRQPGDQIDLSVLRDKQSLSVTVVLSDLSHMGNPDQAELMDSLGGPLSRRRSGFPSVVQHDSVLRPRDCGGPVVGLDGKAVGVNIARASRVASYALPASQVRSVLTELLPADRVQVAHDATGQRNSAGP